MNEMLGNQYFLARRYREATNHFEKTLLLDPTNYKIKKKLVICYLQNKQINLALKLFASLISEKIEIVLNSDINSDDCPCRQMIQEVEQLSSKNSESEKNICLAILWLYCDALTSREYFNKLLVEDPKNIVYRNISDSLNQLFQNKKEG